MKQTQSGQAQVTVSDALDAELGSIDELTQAKLQAVRLKALEQQSKAKWWQLSWQNKGLMASAFSVTLAVVVWFSPSQVDDLNQELLMQVMQNPELTEDPDMLEQLEFLAWLEQEALVTGSGV